MTPTLSAAPGTLTAPLALQGVHAIASGLPTADWVPVLIVVVAIGALLARAQPRRRHEAPLRWEMQARPLTFGSNVHDVQVNVLGMWSSAARNNGALLGVYGDAFEVASMFAPLRLFGQQWCYRAGDTTMEVVPGRWYDWIEIAGLPSAEQEVRKTPVLGRVVNNLGGGPFGMVIAGLGALSLAGPQRIRIRRKKTNREIWDALVRAGVHPTGAPPR